MVVTAPWRPGDRPPPGSADPGQDRHRVSRSPAATRPPAKPLGPALDKTFKVGLVLKGLDGVLEVAGGILLLLISPHAIEHLVHSLTAHELSEDAHDLVARLLLHTTARLGRPGGVGPGHAEGMASQAAGPGNWRRARLG
jgi:hypothetical protein